MIRASAGRGVRNPNLLIENLKYMPSHKSFDVQETIMPEVAWNYARGIERCHGRLPFGGPYYS